MCEQICKVDKINTDAWLMLNMANKELGLAIEAIAALESAAKLNPQNAFVQNEKRAVAGAGRPPPGGDQCIQARLRDAPDPATVLVNMRVVYGHMGQPVLALEALDETVSRNPQAPATYIQRSVLLGMLGRMRRHSMRLNKRSGLT